MELFKNIVMEKKINAASVYSGHHIVQNSTDSVLYLLIEKNSRPNFKNIKKTEKEKKQ